MNTHRFAATGIPFLLLACLASPVAGQTAPEGEPPTGFSGAPWGSGSGRLIETFGGPSDIDGEQLHWHEVPILGKNAEVFADVRRGVGLVSGAYVWPFGTDGVGQLSCGLHAVDVQRRLTEKYGTPTRDSGASGKCGEIFAIWEWPERNVSIDLYTQAHATQGYNVFLVYRDQQRDQAADRADAEDRL